MKHKGKRIRHVEAQVARLEAELNEVRRIANMVAPIAPKPITLGGGAIGLTPNSTKPYLINECGPHRGTVPEKVQS